MAVAQTIDRRSGSVADERTNEPPAEVDAAIDSTFEKLETRQSSFHSVNILFNSCLATGDYLPSFFDPAFERFLCSSSRKSGRRKTRKHFISARRTPGLTSGWILLNALLDEGSKTNLHSYFPHKVKAYETIPARSIDKETLG
ncbi:hypothetical protein V9T40_004472 [Parthenolecanium corni]|uniref:Uncharacterized protein n=1 Tax=Parthenolecanium corni TaxID=536013 RepID=A0AAN9U1Z2_9HEMI